MKKTAEQKAKASVNWATPPELAGENAVSHQTILALIESGELPAVDFSLTRKRPRYRVKRSDWEAFLERRTVKPRPPVTPRRRATLPDVEEFY